MCICVYLLRDMSKCRWIWMFEAQFYQNDILRDENWTAYSKIGSVQRAFAGAPEEADGGRRGHLEGGPQPSRSFLHRPTAELRPSLSTGRTLKEKGAWGIFIDVVSSSVIATPTSSRTEIRAERNSRVREGLTDAILRQLQSFPTILNLIVFVEEPLISGTREGTPPSTARRDTHRIACSYFYSWMWTIHLQIKRTSLKCLKN